MDPHHYKASSFYRLVQPLASDLLKYGVHRKARDQDTIEFPGPVTITLTNPDGGAFKTAGRQTSMRYLSAEFLWYLSQDLRIDYIGEYASMWPRIADKHGFVNSNYGYHMLNSEWRYVYQTLLDDPNSRQAVVAIHSIGHHVRPNKDVPCTMHVAFKLRYLPEWEQYRLDAHVVMRSSDLHFGLPYDIPWFTFYQNQLAKALSLKLGAIKPGCLQLTTHSLHSYQRNHETLQRMASQPATAIHIPEAPLMISDSGDAIMAPSGFMRFLKANVDTVPEGL